MGQSSSRRTHGRTFFGYRETFRHSPTQLGGKTEGIPGTESQDRQHARHYRERRRGCGESGRSRETDYRGIAPDGKRSFAQLGPSSAAEEGSGIQRQAGGESQGKKLYWYTRLGKIEIRRADLHPRSWRAADSTLCGIGGSGVPWVFGSPAASHDRFWCR